MVILERLLKGNVAGGTNAILSGSFRRELQEANFKGNLERLFLKADKHIIFESEF